MATTLVTGATGLLGFNIVKQLLAQQRAVRCLVRQPTKLDQVAESVELVTGDITDAASVRAAMESVTSVFHCAALTEQWVTDKRQFDEVNYVGTKNVVDCAIEAGVQRFVHTSTVDVLKTDANGATDESQLNDEPAATAYSRSKQKANRCVSDAVDQHGLHAVILHPSAIYGPGGPNSSASVMLNGLFVKLHAQKVPFLMPGGLPVVYAPGAAVGHLLAERLGKPGERFILSDQFITLEALAGEICSQLQVKTPRVMPTWAARSFAQVCELGAAVLRKPPLVSKGQVAALEWQPKPSNANAVARLGWSPTDIKSGVSSTLEFLQLSPAARTRTPGRRSNRRGSRS